MLLNEKGILDIDSMIVNNESYRKILEDSIITDEEVAAQSAKVVSMLRDMEAKYSAEQLAEIKSLLAESSVLYAIYNFHSLQQLK
ncbi:MAG: hypothetical protein J6K33_08695 [Alistipes sp.]|nr:hypothetical protein [Rikenellaceae bacterium]MBP3497896.1 hypothetical protein [Alistipes sp.]